MLQATGGELRGAVGSDQQDRDPVLAAGRRHLAGQRLAAEPHQLLVAERVAVLLSLAVAGPLVGQRVRQGGGGVAVVHGAPRRSSVGIGIPLGIWDIRDALHAPGLPLLPLWTHTRRGGGACPRRARRRMWTGSRAP